MNSLLGIVTQTKRQSSALLAHTLSGTPALLRSCVCRAPASDRRKEQSWQPPQSRFVVPLLWSTPPYKSRAAMPGSAFQVVPHSAEGGKLFHALPVRFFAFQFADVFIDFYDVHACRPLSYALRKMSAARL